MKKVGFITFLCIVIDQMVKIIVSSTLKLNYSNEIISNFFNLTYVQNDGAAWSIFSGNRLFLIFVAIMSIILIYVYFIKNKKLTNFENITYGLLLGGIIGNLIDRIIFGYVIDYLDFLIFNYNFPIFNFADICIVVSVFLLIIDIFRGEKSETSSN
ncbi:MAG: signal peptidase II [Firmicutes bacterium]|nr:signal peptidase II [Bacillota bacterium]